MDAADNEWPAQKRASIAAQLSTLGRIGFWVQLVLLAVPVMLAAFLFLLGRTNLGSGAGLDFGNYVAFGSLLVMIFTTCWFFRYIRLGERLKDPAHGPAQSSVLTTLWIGLWGGCLGIVFSMLLLLAAAWRMLFVLLANPQTGVLVTPTPGVNPTYSLSAIDAVSLTLLIISLGAELMVLGLTLWLLFRMTWPAHASSHPEPQMSA